VVLQPGIQQQGPPTPAFVIDNSILEEFVERFRRALDTHWPNSILSYSFKTNSLPWLLAFMEKRGVWAEVVSDFEYRLALAVGYAPEQIVFNGPVKSRDCLREALCEGSLINLDSKREVRWTAELAAERPDSVLAVGLRVNWDLEARIPGESTMRTDSSRFGFSPDNGELGDAISALEAAGVRVAGLHMHRNSLTQSLEVYKASASVAAELISSMGLDLDWIDIGGGFFGSPSGDPTFDQYVSVIRDELAGTVDIDRTQLIVEPGGSLIAVPIEFHAQVIDVKDIGDQRYIVTDASRTDIDPLFRRKRNFAIRVDPAGEATAPSRTCPEQVICGFTCMEDDRLTVLKDAQELKEGDRIVFYRVGAYTMSYQSPFIESPPAVYVRRGDSVDLVRRKGTTDDYLRGSTWTEAALPEPVPAHTEG
jgi:diaminopimelate decarboxylase